MMKFFIFLISQGDDENFANAFKQQQQRNEQINFV